MSHRRAWSLVAEANKAFRTPLVELSRGGEGGGGARLTTEGEAAPAPYRAPDRVTPSADARAGAKAAAARASPRRGRPSSPPTAPSNASSSPKARPILPRSATG